MPGAEDEDQGGFTVTYGDVAEDWENVSLEKLTIVRLIQTFVIVILSFSSVFPLHAEPLPL